MTNRVSVISGARLCENSIGALRLSSGRTVKYLILQTPQPRAEALEAWTGFSHGLTNVRNLSPGARSAFFERVEMTTDQDQLCNQKFIARARRGQNQDRFSVIRIRSVITDSDQVPHRWKI